MTSLLAVRFAVFYQCIRQWNLLCNEVAQDDLRYTAAQLLCNRFLLSLAKVLNIIKSHASETGIYIYSVLLCVIVSMDM